MLSKSERTKLMIIEKASHLFNKKGFHGTSMQDIMVATGLAKGGLYGNFSSKNEMVMEAFEYSFRKVSDELTIRIKSHTTAIDKLISIVEYYEDYLEHPPIEGGCPILNFTSYAEAVPELKKSVQKATKVMLESIERILLKGIQYQQLRPDLDCKLQSEILYSRIEGALMLSKATQDKERLIRLLNDCKSYIYTVFKK